MRLFQTWKHTAATVTGAISLFTAVGGAVLAVDERYAHAGQVDDGFRALQRGQMQQDRRYIQDKIWDLEAKQRRTEFEERRLQELRQELKEVQDNLKRMR
jgi:hypothetical protein